MARLAGTALGIGILLAVGGMLLTGCGDASPRETASVPVVPRPLQARLHPGVFAFGPATSLEVENEEQAAVARLFADGFTAPAGFTPEVRIVGKTADAKHAGRTDYTGHAHPTGYASHTDRTDRTGQTAPASHTDHTSHTGRTGPAGTLRLETDTALAPEHYRLEVHPGRILIQASDLHGFFYALQTLRQQLPAALAGPSPAPEGTRWQLPAQRVDDGPRFPYRGLMLDVSRYFLPPAAIRKMIDGMALLKLNYLHLHLTDDNGWRLEIKRYPRLTQVGAWRVAREGDFAQHKNPKPGEPTPVGGFYTQEEMRDLVAYAAQRQITIIPEIEMPAHTNSSLAAYPSLACPVVKDFIGVLPGLGGHAAEIIYCAGNDEVFSFLQGVIDEVCEIFPSPYIHLGGDEAVKTHWRDCPLCQARMKAEGLTEVEDLQGYFMQRMSAYVQGKGRQVMGWDELTNSRIPEGAIIFGWQGRGEAGYKAGLAGHPFVLTPAQVSYLIRYQGPQWFEPRTYFGNNTLQTVYDYEPVEPGWEPAAAARLMGVQGSLWTEFVTRPADAEYLVFPRLAALAEVAWCPKGSKDWPDFLRRLDAFDERLEAMHIGYARSMYNLDHRVDVRPDTLVVSISSIRPDLDIRYAVGGDEPTAASPRFPGTLRLTAADFSLKAQLYAAGDDAGEGRADTAGGESRDDAAAGENRGGSDASKGRSAADAGSPSASASTGVSRSLNVASTPPGPLPERAYILRAATFSAGRQMGQTLTLALDWNKATARPVTLAAAAPAKALAKAPTETPTETQARTRTGAQEKSPAGAQAPAKIRAGVPAQPPAEPRPVPPPRDTLLYRLTNGLRGSDKYTDFEWCGWQGKDVALVVDLGRRQPIAHVALGCITNYGMGVHLPRRITLSVSDDGRAYRPLADRRLSRAAIFREGIRTEDQTFDFADAAGRYLQIELENPGPCPPDHTRPGQPAWIYLDEVIVR